MWGGDDDFDRRAGEGRGGECSVYSAAPAGHPGSEFLLPDNVTVPASGPQQGLPGQPSHHLTLDFFIFIKIWKI